MGKSKKIGLYVDVVFNGEENIIRRIVLICEKKRLYFQRGKIPQKHSIYVLKLNLVKIIRN